MKITGNEPINPTIWDDRHKAEFQRDNDGLNIRQHFAAMAMIGLLSHNCEHFKADDLEAPGIAKRSCILADALIEELNKNEVLNK